MRLPTRRIRASLCRRTAGASYRTRRRPRARSDRSNSNSDEKPEIRLPRLAATIDVYALVRLYARARARTHSRRTINQPTKYKPAVVARRQASHAMLLGDGLTAVARGTLL